MVDGKTRSFDDMWQRMQFAAATYRQWDELWQRQLTATPTATGSEPTLSERQEALAASRDMPVPGTPTLSSATDMLLELPRRVDAIPQERVN